MPARATSAGPAIDIPRYQGRITAGFEATSKGCFLRVQLNDAEDGLDCVYHPLVGQKSRTETLGAVLAALLVRRVWSQADLARNVGVRTEALRRVLEELRASGVPLESEKDHPHVYWRVPKSWFPGGVLFQQDDVPDLLRQLRRLPRTKARDRLLAVVVEQLPLHARGDGFPPIVSRTTTEQDEQYVPVVEDAAAKRVPLAMSYHSASRGKITQRYASVHLVDAGPPARFVATCHRNGDLRWFRVDGIVRARLDEREPFRECAPSAVAAFCAASLDGFKGEGTPIAYSFLVRDPDANWVANNLLEGMRAETLHDGIRVHVETSAILRLARFVVSLGGAAQPEDAALTAAVAQLARGALEQLRGDMDPGKDPSFAEAAAPGAVQPRSDV